MNANQSTANKISQLTAWYGDGANGTCPTSAQWLNVLSLDEGLSFKLINFFKFREIALYPTDQQQNTKISGTDAFDLYAATSIPTMQNAGGSFAHVAPYTGSLLGDQEDWDLIAIGSYPDNKCFWELYSDSAYREAFAHRTAACEKQKVLLTLDM